MVNASHRPVDWGDDGGESEQHVVCTGPDG